MRTWIQTNRGTGASQLDNDGSVPLDMIPQHVTKLLHPWQSASLISPLLIGRKGREYDPKLGDRILVVLGVFLEQMFLDETSCTQLLQKFRGVKLKFEDAIGCFA